MLITKDQLEKWYLNDKLSTWQIASKLGCAQNAVRYYLKKYKIRSRTLSEAQKVCESNYLKKPRTEEWKRKKSKFMTENNPRSMLRKHHSDETKKKIFNAQTTTGKSKNTKAYKKLAMENLPKRCDICHTEKNLCVHHRDGDHFNNQLKNLRILCRACQSSRYYLGSSWFPLGQKKLKKMSRS